MKWIEVALRNRTLTWAAFLITMILGLASLPSISRREDPDLDGRAYQIIVQIPGASVSRVEQLVSDKIDRALLELDDTKTVESTSRPNVAVIRVEPSDYTKDLGGYTRKLRARIDDLRKELPAEVASIDVNDRFTDTVAMIIGVSRPGASPRELEDDARKIRRRLRSMDSVANADLIGEPKPRLYVRLDTAKLAQYGLSLADLKRAIAAQNVYSETGGGVDAGSKRLEFSASGELGSLGALADLPLARSDGSHVALRDVATVETGYLDPPDSLLRINGERAVAVAITMRKGLDLTKFGDDIRTELAKVRDQLPATEHVEIVNDLPSSVKSRIHEFAENLATGVGLIALVTFLFMGVRAAFVVTLSLPITVIGIFLMMKLLGRDIQQISVAALIISLGLVVDNSIVIVDNIERKLAQGIKRLLAVESGTTELFGPLLASNLTTIGAFGPLAFLSGGKGDFIRDLGLITSVATLVSMALNVTIIPILAGALLRVESGDHLGFIQRLVVRLFASLSDRIAWLANAGLRRPGLTLLAAIVALVLSAGQIPRLGQQFFPGALRNQFAIDVILPEGSTIEATEGTVVSLEAMLRKEPKIVNFASYVGQGSPRFYYNFTPEAPAPSIAQIVVNTVDADATDDLLPRLQTAANRDVPGATVIVKRLTQGPPFVAPIAIRLHGDQVEDLRRAASEAYKLIRTTKGAGRFYDDYREPRLVSRLAIDEEKANDAGVSPAEVARFANLGYAGQTVTQFRDGDREIPVSLQFASAERSATGRIQDLYLPSRNGDPVRIGDVSREEFAIEPSRVVRRNGVRTLTLYGYSDGSRTNMAVFDDVWKRIKLAKLPGGVTAEYAGDKKERELSFAEIGLVSAIGVLFNVLCIAWLFPNWRIVLAVSLATPLSLIGGVLGLILAHQPFGFMAVLGIVSLSGVATNHTIVFFEYALDRRRQGMPLREALVQAGRDRFRPIVLTVLLSIMGLIPQAVNGGSLWPPLADSLIFGLALSLLLTLVVVPSTYALLARNEKPEAA